MTQRILQKNGFNVGVEAMARKAISRIIEEQPLLVILDLMLPGADALNSMS